MFQMKWVSLNKCLSLTEEEAWRHRKEGLKISKIKNWQDSDSWSIFQRQLIDLHANKRKTPSSETDQPKSNKTNINLESKTDLSMQLHGIVRTDMVQHSLRLLDQGADPNFKYAERLSNTPLHIAALSGQALQVELLCANGGDPWLVNDSGETCEDLAQESGFTALAIRIQELKYVLPRTMINFISPDCYKMLNFHPESDSIHFVLPNYLKNEFTEKFSKLSPEQFSTLCEDVYDEIDRRTLNDFAEKQFSLPFLPILDEYSKTRNQTRQQLAKFSKDSFDGFCCDILYELAERMDEEVFVAEMSYNRPGSKELELISSADELENIEKLAELKRWAAAVDERDELIKYLREELKKSEAEKEVLQTNLTKLANDIIAKNSEPKNSPRKPSSLNTPRESKLLENNSLPDVKSLPDARTVAVKSKQASVEIMQLMKAYKSGDHEKSKHFLKKSSLEIQEFLGYFPRIGVTEMAIKNLEFQLDKLIVDINGGKEKYTDVLRCLHEVAMLLKRLVQICTTANQRDSSFVGSVNGSVTARSSTLVGSDVSLNKF